MRFTAFLNALLIALPLSASSALAALIPLKTTWTSTPNPAPPYYVWQNDPSLTEFLSNGVTGLCIPASISNAMIYEYAFKTEKAAQLKLPGLTQDPQTQEWAVDSNAVIRYFARACHYTNSNGTPVADGVNCITQFYRDSGYKNPDVKAIRKGLFTLDSSIAYENRAPNLKDVNDALTAGYEVIASIVTMRFEPTTQKWIKTTSHSLNVYGSIGNQWIASNPTRAYNVNFKDSVFDLLDVKENAEGTVEVSGRLIGRPNQTTFLAGVTFFKPE